MGTALILAATSSWACGGFFCNRPADPVVQSAERILFHVDEEAGTTTTYVEIVFQGPPIQFGWVLPIPPGITADDVTTAPAGLFDALEEETAPVFVEAAFGGEASDVGASTALERAAMASCGCGRAAHWDGKTYVEGDTGFVPQFSGVELLGSSVVGPYAIELIEADDGDTFQQWLLFNGYQMPQSATKPLQYYIDAGMNFLGVQLSPDTKSGPIDTLVFTTPGTVPMIPLRLTAIAAAADMDIVAYTLSGARMAPTNYIDLPFSWDSVNWVDTDVTDYEDELMFAIDEAGGRAWNTEFAGATIDLVTENADATALLEQDAYLTRFHTRISADEMTDDPMWANAPDLPDQEREHAIGWDEEAEAAVPGWLALLLWPATVAVLRRRTRIA